MVRTSRSRFLEAIRQELSDGLGMVPFVGAGISAPSGIPVTGQLTPYLADCVRAAVQNEWDPRHGAWPMFGDWPPALGSRGTGTPLQQLKSMLDGGGPIGELNLAALGANTEWLAQLQFLSRYTKVKHGEPELLRIERDVLDAFVRHICAERRPSLAHRMLARMRRMLRIRLILTTNFDNLIESAFEETDTPYEVYDVPDAGKLPPAALVLNEVASVVKLHGGRYAYRADYSLLDSPSLDDRRRLLSYLTGRLTTVEHFEQTIVDSSDRTLDFRSRRQLDIPRHLLVIGVGGRDARIISLFQSALRFSAHTKIFWLCRHEDERARIEAALTTNLTDKEKTRIFFDSTPHPGLFLAELFQRLSYSLPPPLPFPVAWRLPVPPTPEPSVRPVGTGVGDGSTTRVFGQGIRDHVLPVFFELSDLRRNVTDSAPLTYFRSKLFLAISSCCSEDPNLPISKDNALLARILLERMAWNRRWRVIIDWTGCDDTDVGGVDEMATFVTHIFESLDILPGPDAFVSTEVVHVTSDANEGQRRLAVVVQDHAQREDHAVYSQVGAQLWPVKSQTDAPVTKDEGKRLAALFKLALLLQRRARIPRYNIVSTLVTYDRPQSDVSARRLQDMELKYTQDMQGLVVDKMIADGAARAKPGGFLWMDKRARRRQLRDAIDQLASEEATLLEEVRERVADFYEKTFFALRESVAFFESIEHRLFEECLETGRIVTTRARGHRIQRDAIQALAMTRIARGDLVRIGLVPELQRRLRQLEALSLETLGHYWPNGLQLAPTLVPLAHLVFELRRLRFDLSSEVGRLPSPHSEEVTPAETSAASEVWGRLGQASWPATAAATTPGELDVEANFRQWLIRDCARHFEAANAAARCLYTDVCRLPSLEDFPGAALLDVTEPWACFVDRPGLLPGDTNFVLQPLNASIKSARLWVEETEPTEATICLAVRVLVRLLFRAILFSDQIRLRIRASPKSADRPAQEDRLKRPVLVAMHIYHFAFELTRHLHTDTDFLLRYRARLRTLVAVACFELGRRSEAERRLGEALAQLSASDGRETPLWRAANLIVEAGGAMAKARRPFGREDERTIPVARQQVRRWIRASTRLSDSERSSWRMDKDEFLQEDFHRSVFASASDAEAALAEAERCLVGARRNVWWRARLLCTRIKAIEYRTTAFALQVLAMDDRDLALLERDGIPSWGTGSAPAFAPMPISRTFRRLMALVLDDSFHLVRGSVSYLAVADAVEAVRIRCAKVSDGIEDPESPKKRHFDGLIDLCEQRLRQVHADLAVAGRRIGDVLNAPDPALCRDHKEALEWTRARISSFEPG